MTRLVMLPLLIASLLGCRDTSDMASRDQAAEVEKKHEASSALPSASSIDPDSKDGIDDGLVSSQVGMPESASVGTPDGSSMPAKNPGKSRASAFAGVARSAQQNIDFENMLKDFLRCWYDDLWVPDVIGHRSEFPENPYFEKYGAKSCGADGEFRHYCVQEVFHGLDVTRMVVPIQGGIPRVSIFVNHDLQTARKILRAKVGSEFRESPASVEGRAPELKQDPQDASTSILVCSRDF